MNEEIKLLLKELMKVREKENKILDSIWKINNEEGK